jgi:hypothetical protein
MAAALEEQLAVMREVVEGHKDDPVPQVPSLLEVVVLVAVAENQVRRLLAVVVARVVLAALVVKVMHEFTVGKGIIWATQK